jgi:hypothetical protein
VLLLCGRGAAGVIRTLTRVLREKCSARQQRKAEDGGHDLLHSWDISLFLLSNSTLRALGLYSQKLRERVLKPTLNFFSVFKAVVP